MAKMIPSTPKEFAPESLEGVMFHALELLPDEYYVFHSFRIMNVQKGIVHESETDFVIFSKEQGLLCLEAKAGQVSYRNGRWYYGSGLEMTHGGPFLQAANNEYKIRRLFENRGLWNVMNDCRSLHAVWFPSITRRQLSSMSFPPDGDKALVMTKDDLDNPLSSIERLFSLQPSNRRENKLSEAQASRILNEVLCPAFDLLVPSNLNIDLERYAFKRMLREQIKVLDFLEEQPFAAVNGMAGTGKTVVALERAQRCALKGEKVLFLCFNRFLRDHLEAGYKNELIDFFTIDGLSAKMLKNGTGIDCLSDALMEAYLLNEFDYQHIIVDEGQDFGQTRLEESGILQTLCDIALDHEDGTFFAFYDKMQLVHNETLPSCIQEAECRIVLRTNCRNTKNIATTSLKPLRIDKIPPVKDGRVSGVMPNLFVGNNSSDQIELIEKAIHDCLQSGFRDVIILSCVSLDKSSALPRIVDGFYRGDEEDVPITTCRKFKGLEADAVILIDVNRDALLENDGNVFYVGASRARFKLDIVASLNDAECLEVLRSFGRTSARKPKKTLAVCLNAILA